MATTRIKDIASTNTNPQSGQYLAIDGSATQKIDYSVLKSSIIGGHETQIKYDLLPVSSNARGAAHLSYNPATKQVLIFGHIYDSNSMAMSTPLFDTIPAAYRPSDTVEGSAMLYYNSTFRVANAYARADGGITQGQSNSTTNMFFVISYFM